MAFSFVRIILPDSEIEIYKRGLAYFKRGLTDGESMGTAAYRATVRGTEQYYVSLGFKWTGSPRYMCSCPYYEKNEYVCKHIIASSLEWDSSRNVPQPTIEEAELLCIPPPDITYADIKRAYNNPLGADLNVLRLASDNLGSWHRPHARLPEKPRPIEKGFVKMNDLLLARKNLLSWPNRRQYDLYFCAGEMEAGFCEMLRWIKVSILSLPIAEQLKALQIVVELHHEVLESIDDSDGLHIFGETHLVDLCDTVEKESNLITQDQEILKKVRIRIDDY